VVSAPVFTLPKLACNTHCHVFGPIDRFPYADPRPYTPPEAPKEMLAAAHTRLGIARAVVVQATCHGTDNAVTLDAIASSNGTYRGVAIVDDGFDTAQLEALHRGGIRGVRFSFIKKLGGAPDLATVRRVADRIRAFGWHMVLLVDAADVSELRDMLAALPVPFVIDHMGRVRASEGVKQTPFATLLDLLDLENAWVKICGLERTSSTGAPFDDAIPFASALIRKAPDRVLWGTDWPHPNIAHLPDDADLVDAIPRFAPDAASQERLLVTNPSRLYGF
jgi:2-pyrone-4,6-dicarboxylate lactonase